ncbi:furin-like isoform X2 [Paramormyrops kingsleyae]|uniref:furin-like isoform X2 n=1 Tax=Paramormyrops kingsleyae TaxID=1676925 RepID=UPI000CD60FB0|nr:furin-like isoform X2 [Paramormyrops kingsleyae]
MKLLWFGPAVLGLCIACATTNSWAVHLNAPPEHVERFAGKLGFHSLGKVFWFAQQSKKTGMRRDPASQPNDPPLTKQWNLRTFDPNVRATWAVLVSITDDGMEESHLDLEENDDPQTSYNMNSNDPNSEPRYTPMKVNWHVGGVTSVASNRACAVGVAYQATNGGIQMLDSHVTDLAKAKSPSFNQQHTDICSAGWAPEDNGRIVKGPSTLPYEASIRGGRGDLGSIYVWGCGNSGTSHGNCDLDGYSSSIQTLSVSSTTESRKSAFYIELCAAILTAVYSGSSLHRRTVVRHCRLPVLHTSYVGTSAPAHLVASITALVLEANPALTWRDGQHTTIQPSRPSHLRSDDWQTNGAGRPVSHYYGHGRLDAGKLVHLARKWTAVHPQRKCMSDVITRPLELHGNLILKWNETACLRTRNWIRSLEHIRARLTLTYTRHGDLSIVLISPLGAQSTLVTIRHSDASTKGYSDWALTSFHSWNEDPTGEWTLQIEKRGYWPTSGILSKFQLELYGTRECMRARRVGRTPVWKCLILSSNGSCTECTYPLYLFENACLPSCPPHYYEWGNSTQSPRRCQSCHHTCHTCFGHRETNCLDCPPFSTLDPQLSTCSTPSYPWDHQTEVGESMKWSGLILGILFGGPLVLACFLCAAAWAVHGIIQIRTAARSQPRGNENFGDFRGVEGAALNELEESHSL